MGPGTFIDPDVAVSTREDLRLTAVTSNPPTGPGTPGLSEAKPYTIGRPLQLSPAAEVPLLDDQRPLRRAPAIRVVERRQVREAIAKVAVGIEDLQREAAFLIAMSAYRQNGSRPDVSPLRKKVEAAKTKLETAVAKLPENLRNHGRVTDLRKAIASLESLLPPVER